MTVTQSLQSRTATSVRPAVKILLIGDEADVVATIKNLHRRGFAQVDSWSTPASCDRASKSMGKMISDRYSDQSISVLTKTLG